MKHIKFILPILPSGKLFFKKPYAYGFKPIAFLGRFIILILPYSYLSYLCFLGRLVSFGNLSVSSKTPTNKGFGNIGKVFLQKLFRNGF